MNQLQQLTIEILIASTIQGRPAEDQIAILIATILVLVEKNQ